MKSLLIALLCLSTVSLRAGSTNQADVVSASVAVSTLRLVGNGGTPTITTNIFGAGSGTAVASIGAGSTDLAGYISFTAGNSPAANTNVLTITFAQPLTNVPVAIIIREANPQSAGLVRQFYVNRGTVTNTSWQIWASTTAAVLSTTYEWYYEVIGR